MASQQHGFTWEDEIKNNVFHVVDRVGYTAIDDIPESFNNGTPASIKTYGASTVFFSDAIRMFQNTGREKYEAICLHYDQEDETKTLTHIAEVDLSASRNLLFGEITLLELQALDREIKSLPKGKLTDEARAAIHAHKDRLNAKSGWMKLSPKMDSGSQRRLQCSLPKFPTFLSENSARILYQTKDGKLRGVQLTKTIESGKRKRTARS